jgi:hypothetical protein
MVKLETMKYIFRRIPVERFKWVLTCNDPTWDNNRACCHVYGSLVEDKGRCYISISALASGNSCLCNGITTMVEVEPDSVKLTTYGDYKANLHMGGK